MNLWYTFAVTIQKPGSNRMNYVKKLRSSAQLSDINTTEYEKLVSPEDFDRAQELRAKHRIGKRDKNGRSVGQSPCKHIWGNKLVCTCSHTMNRRIAHQA